MDFMLTGESYAGHYIPAFSNALLDDDAFSGIFKASLMGDPYTAGLTQKRLMYKVPEALNILDDSNMPQIAALNKNCVESVVADYDTSYEVCCKIMNYIEDVSGGVYAYD
jgi:carboxypeptidase C (cathepsin A)|mmetsp:Transcript_36556/g.47979  ORF Transcript_36556/g.47979 Transcript_36556/m.47979 type:complete len:110 (+) Transcript_36556:584-913(+)